MKDAIGGMSHEDAFLAGEKNSKTSRRPRSRAVEGATQFFKRIDENTSVPMKIVVPVIGMLLACTVWLTTMLIGIKNSVGHGWTVDHMETWGRQLEDKNPAIKTPYARDIWRAERPELSRVEIN